MSRGSVDFRGLFSSLVICQRVSSAVAVKVVERILRPLALGGVGHGIPLRCSRWLHQQLSRLEAVGLKRRVTLIGVKRKRPVARPCLGGVSLLLAGNRRYFVRFW